MSYQCPTCGSWRSCWSPEIFDLPTMPSSEQVAGGGGVDALRELVARWRQQSHEFAGNGQFDSGFGWGHGKCADELEAALSTRDDGAMVSDAMVERAAAAYVENGLGGKMCSHSAMRDALEAAQAAPQQDDTP